MTDHTNSPLVRGHGSAIAAIALLAVLALQCFESRAELLFRSAEQLDGAAQGPVLRRYDNPADTVYPRWLADGTRLASEEVQVFLRGDITQKDAYAVRVLENLVVKGRQRISGNTVSLAGAGGDVDAAMEVGRVLRKLGVYTAVAREDQCLSSCVFAFMGGDRRTVDGRIGIHRPYFSSNRKVENRRAHYRNLQNRLRTYIEELDFPPSFYEALMAVPSESMNILGAADLKRYYLQGMSPSAAEEADAATARNRGISVLEYLQQKAQALPCAGVVAGNGSCSPEAQVAGGSGASASVKSSALASDSALRRGQPATEALGSTLGAASAR